MSSIVTFYSYKGGVGRSMAVANIAYELAKRNKRVLVVDWDLEAPGIERYFDQLSIKKDSEGLLQLLISFKKDLNPDYRDYLWTVDTSFKHPIYLLHSGREKDPAKYSSDLESFAWDSFFNNKGGFYLEGLRNNWLKDFDLVLIDSRTGLSDASGICSILLPDILIPMFTANYQSLFGIRDIISFIQNARQKLTIKRMALTILPIPARFGTRVEFKEAQEWLDRIAHILKDCFSDWLPKWIEPRYVFEQIKIPQVDYFSFGEKLAVLEQGTTDPESMGFIYAKLADFLGSDFSDLETFIGKSYYNERKSAFELNRATENKNSDQAAATFKYDVFISYPRSVYQWVREVMLPALTEYLNDALGYNPQIFFDASEVSPGTDWNASSKSALDKSKVFLFVFTELPDSAGDFVNNELLFAETRQSTTKTNVVFPILFKKGRGEINLPPFIHNKQLNDLSPFSREAISSSTKLNAQFGNIMEQLVRDITKSIQELNNVDNTSAIEGKNNQIEVESLAFAYENLRKQMPASNNRTRLMQEIVEKMKSNASAIEPLSSYLVTSTSPGKRLAVIAALQERPNIDYVDWLAEHVGDVEKPFIGFQAALALYTCVRSLGNKKQVSKAIEKALANIDKFDYKDRNQISVLESAKAELSFKRVKVFVSYDHSEDAHYKDLLRAWNANSNFDFEIDLRSPTVSINSDEARVVQGSLVNKMKESEYVLVIIGEKSYSSNWMNWEIDRAKQSDINLKFSAVKIKPSNRTPSNLPSYTAIASKFTLNDIEKALRTAKTNA